MSSNYIKVCSQIVNEFFGDDIKKVAEVLLIDGAQNLRHIIMRTQFPFEKVKESLRLLIQHNLVNFTSTSGYSQAVYAISKENIFFLLRLPRALDIVNESLGAEARGLIEEIVCRGQLPLSKLLFICGLKNCQSRPDVSKEGVISILKLYHHSFVALAINHYTCTCPTLIEDPLAHVPTFDPKDNTKGFINQDINFEAIADKILANDSDLITMDDATKPWQIDIQNFNREWRDSIILKALGNRYKNYVDIKIFRILMRNFRTSSYSEGLPLETLTLDFRKISDQLNSLSGSEKTLETLDQQLEIIMSDPKCFIDKFGGEYSLNYATAMEYLMYETVEKIILKRHGFFAARIFRLIKENKYVEQDRIQELGMIQSKEAKHLAFILMEENFIQMKEVRKNYKPNAQSNKVAYVFSIDINTVINSLLGACYQAIANCHTRNNVIKYQSRMLLAKEERISRILTTAREKGCGEDQLQEIEEMITPPERSVLQKVNHQKDKLVCGIFNLDETIFILQQYMNCQKKKNVPKMKGSKT